MTTREPIQATVIREPSPDAVCSCDHPVGCDCSCHDRRCDPAEDVCHVDFLPDEGGFAYWGCPRCTPGQEFTALPRLRAHRLERAPAHRLAGPWRRLLADRLPLGRRHPQRRQRLIVGAGLGVVVGAGVLAGVEVDDDRVEATHLVE